MKQSRRWERAGTGEKKRRENDVFTFRQCVGVEVWGIFGLAGKLGTQNIISNSHSNSYFFFKLYF
jgi:hypothetical protein